MHSLWGRQRAMLYKWHCLNPCACSLSLLLCRPPPFLHGSPSHLWKGSACVCLKQYVNCGFAEERRCCVQAFSHGEPFTFLGFYEFLPYQPPPTSFFCLVELAQPPQLAMKGDQHIVTLSDQNVPLKHFLSFLIPFQLCLTNILEDEGGKNA